MKRSLAKQALNAIARTKNAAVRNRQDNAYMMGQGLTLVGAAAAALNDHKFGTPEEPAKLMKNEGGTGGIPTNLVAGLGVAAVCAFAKVPGRKYLGPLALGVGCGGVYRGLMEHWETTK